MKRYVTKTKLDVNELVLDETTEPWVVLEKDCTFKIRGDVIDKLADYEDLEEQGRLVKLPCKVGDVVYAYCGEFGILEYDVDSIVIDKHITYQCSAYSEPIRDCPSECLDEIEPDISDFGKTVFLTKSEAEAKLKELRGNNE